MLLYNVREILGIGGRPSERQSYSSNYGNEASLGSF